MTNLPEQPTLASNMEEMANMANMPVQPNLGGRTTNLSELERSKSHRRTLKHYSKKGHKSRSTNNTIDKEVQKNKEGTKITMDMESTKLLIPSSLHRAIRCQTRKILQN